MITTIIPTLWLYPDLLRDTINKLTQESSIDEIVLIDNNKLHSTPSILNHSKLVIVTPQKNVGCNPAWNLGVKVASHDKLFFLSDDFFFDFSMCHLIEPHITEDKGLILSDTTSSSSDMPLRLSPINWPDKWIHGWASAFFVHRKVYNFIPESLKVHCGDNWLLDTIPNQHYVLRGISFSQEFSGSVNFIRNLNSSHPLYVDSTRDEILYEQMKQHHPQVTRIKNKDEIYLLR